MDDYKFEFMCDKLKNLFTEYWNDEYLTNLSIVDHCRELVQAWDKHKMTKSEMDRFENESTDLFILLCFKNMMTTFPPTETVDFDFDLILDRLEKFQSKLGHKHLE